MYSCVPIMSQLHIEKYFISFVDLHLKQIHHVTLYATTAKRERKKVLLSRGIFFTKKLFIDIIRFCSNLHFALLRFCSIEVVMETQLVKSSKTKLLIGSRRVTMTTCGNKSRLFQRPTSNHFMSARQHFMNGTQADFIPDN